MVVSTCSVCGRKFTADPWKENIYICPGCAAESAPLAAADETATVSVSDPLPEERHSTGWTIKTPETRRHTRKNSKAAKIAEVPVVTEEVPIDQIPPEVAAALGIAEAVYDGSTANPGKTFFAKSRFLWGALAVGCVPLAVFFPEWGRLFWVAGAVFAALCALFVFVVKSGEKK